MSVAVLVATVGSASANVYTTLAEANQYHDNRPAVGTTWTAASSDQKNAALLWATLLMDANWVWQGYPVDAVQALLWPRGGMLKRNHWEYVALDAIPTELKNATAEYARQLLASDLAGNNDIETQGILGLTAGPVTLRFKETVVAKPVPDTVVYLIPREWGYPRSRSTGSRDLVRT